MHYTTACRLSHVLQLGVCLGWLVQRTLCTSVLDKAQQAFWNHDTTCTDSSVFSVCVFPVTADPAGKYLIDRYLAQDEDSSSSSSEVNGTSSSSSEAAVSTAVAAADAASSR
jgi:hypothetical protein